MKQLSPIKEPTDDNPLADFKKLNTKIRGIDELGKATVQQTRADM